MGSIRSSTSLRIFHNKGRVEKKSPGSSAVPHWGWLMAVLQLRTHQKTIILQIPLVYLYAILPLTGIMMFIRTVQVIHEDIQQLRINTDSP